MEPNEEQFELPQLARIGIRYSFGDGLVDRTFAHVSKHGIRFWCDSPDREVEIVYASQYDLLLWNMCVGGGFCGGLSKGEPISVNMLLPATGMVSAEDFAALALRGEGDGGSPPAHVERWTAFLRDKFIEYMGRSSVPVEELKQNLAEPFDSVCT